MKKRLLIGIAAFLLLLGALFAVTGCSPKAETVTVNSRNMPQNTYVLGTDLNRSVGSILADGTPVPLNDEHVTIEGYDKNTLGEQMLTISYGGQSVQFKVTVVPRFSTQKTYVYFTGELFSDASPLLTVTKDDGTRFNVQADDPALTLTNFDTAKPAETLTVGAAYEKNGEHYEGAFDISVVTPVITFNDTSASLKKEYGSHQAADELDLTGASARLASPDKTTQRVVTAEKLTATGFDPTAVNKDQPDDVEQTIQVFYRGNAVGSYQITVSYSDVSKFKDFAATVAGLDWNCYKQPTAQNPGMVFPANTTEEMKTDAVEMFESYLGMKDDEASYITAEELAAVARIAVIHGYNTWRSTVNSAFKDYFTVDEYAAITYTCDTLQEAQTALDILKTQNDNKPDSDLQTLLRYSEMLNHLYVGLLSDTLLYTGSADGETYEDGYGIKITELADLIPTTEYFIAVQDVLGWAIDAYQKGKTEDALKTNVEGADGIYERVVTEIGSRSYQKEDWTDQLAIDMAGGFSIYEMMNAWTEADTEYQRKKGDFFEGVYRYYYQMLKKAVAEKDSDAEKTARSRIDDLHPCIDPQPLQEIRSWFENGTQIQLFLSGSMASPEPIYESTLFIYLYNEAVQKSEDFITQYKGKDDMYMFLFTQYFGSALTSMLSGTSGYLDLLDAAAYDDKVAALWQQYIEIWLAADADPEYTAKDEFATKTQKMFEAFLALKPAEQIYFIRSMNYEYVNGTPNVALYPDENDNFYSDFTRFIYLCFSDKIEQQVADDTEAGNTVYTLFADMMLALEFYLNSDFNGFCNTMETVISTYDGWNQVGTAYTAFNTLFGTFYQTQLARWNTFEKILDGDDKPVEDEYGATWQLKTQKEELTSKQQADIDALTDSITVLNVAESYIDGLLADLGLSVPLYVNYLASYEHYKELSTDFLSTYGSNSDVMAVYNGMPVGGMETGTLAYFSYLYEGKYALYLNSLGFDKETYELSEYTPLRNFLKTYDNYFWAIANLMTQGVVTDPYAPEDKEDDPDADAAVKAEEGSRQFAFNAENIAALLADFYADDMTAQLQQAFLLIDGNNFLHEGLNVFAEQLLFPDNTTAQQLVDALLSVQVNYIGYQIAGEEDKAAMLEDIQTAWATVQEKYEALQSAESAAQADGTDGTDEQQSDFEVFENYFGDMYDHYASVVSGLLADSTQQPAA